MTVPSFAEVNRIESAATMRDLLRRDDLPRDPQWWSAVISVGQSALAGAEAGRADAEQWAPVLVEALDVAARQPAFGIPATVLRRVLACLAAMEYFGERAGDPVRDPELVFRHLAESLGGTAEAYLDRYRVTLARALAEHERVRAGEGDVRAVSADRGWLDSTRGALTQMCEGVAPRLSGDALRAEAAAWCAALPEIVAIRGAAKTAREAG